MRNCCEVGIISAPDRGRSLVSRTLYYCSTILSVAIVTLLFVLPARAQFSANFQTITISGVTSNWAGNGSYVVGSNTFSDTLQIINSAILSNGTGVLGFTPVASNNTAIVSGTGSLWKNTTNLFVGFLGTGNQLIVTNGGRVLDPAGTLGYTNVSQSIAWVTGAGSVWSNTQFLYVGYSGSANQLIITNGGLAWSGAGYVGVNSFSSNNAASVIGTGSVWVATNALFVGDLGSSNTLAIATGGKAAAAGSYLGVDVSSSNNLISVTGPGSTFSNTFDFFLGLSGSNNQLIVSNGAYAGDTSGFIGFTNSSGGNSALIGSASIWSNKTDLYVGYLGSFNQMLVTNGGHVFSGVGYIGWFNNASNNTATITGTGSVWSATNDIYVGFVGSSNQLTIANGANVSALESRIGFNPAATNSSALITGSGSTWSNQIGTVVGFGGVASQLTIANGATVFDAIGVVGETNQSSRNTATVTGNGSTWINTNVLYDGFLASSNQLVIANGGAANAPSTYLAVNSSSTSNLLAVTGTGSILSNTFNTYVGFGGSSNELFIANGATVWDEVGVIGYTNTSIQDVAWVQGPGATWSNAFFLAVGYNGRQAQLTVTNGGSVFSGNGYLGLIATSSSNNTATITGSGSVWSTTNGLYVGEVASSNQLSILNGGAVFSPTTFVGFNPTSASNLVVVSGTGSILSNIFNTLLGYFGGQNRLVISNGGSVFGLTGIMGFTNFSIGNTALVDGSGSTWSNSLFLELNSVGNQLTITNGGTVFSGDGYLGAELTAASNTVVVTGAGSFWTLNNSLYVGYQAINNSLTIRAGGAVVDQFGSLGQFSNGNNNSVLVTDTGSVWSNTAGLIVGQVGFGNSLTVSNGGAVFGTGSSFSSNNSVFVIGPGSILTAPPSQGMFIGDEGTRDLLSVSSGGSVFAETVIIGAENGTNNTLIVEDSASTLTSTNRFTSLIVGEGSFGNRLAVSNGAKVFESGLSYIGQATSVPAISNNVIVSGTASVWSNAVDLFIGYLSYGDSLAISNAGVVFNNNASLGYDNSGSSGSNNLGTVTGSGSIWNNAGTLTIGAGGPSNQLFVTLGGKVITPNLLLGPNGKANNLLRLSGGIIQAGAINIGTGNFLTGSGTLTGKAINFGTISANISGGTLTFANGLKNQGFVSATNGGIFEVYGTFLNLGTTSFTGGTAIFHSPVLSAQGTTNLWSVTGSGLWEQGVDWSLGVPSTTNTAILVTNAVSKTVTVSSNTFASAPGSVTNFGIRFSGPSGSTNTLLVANTPTNNPFVMVKLTIDTNAVAIVTNATLQVGVQSSGTLIINGNVQVTSGGLFDSSNTGTMNIGLAGSGAFSVVSGGTALSAAVSVGVDSLGSTAIVSDIGSVWSNGFFQLDSGSLMITNGGTMISLGGDIGGNGGINGATGIVSDTGSVWITDGLIISPDEGENDQLIITNGGVVHVLQSTVAVDQFGGGNNQLIVSGNGALLDASPATLYVGLFSFLPDRVDIGPGGTVLASFVNLGQGSGATNLINVTGGSLFVTNAFGSTMQIFQGTLVLNGGTVTVDDLILKTNLGVVAFSAGTLYSAHTEATNSVPFIVGDGTDAANFNLLGGVHSFNSLEITNAAVLSGCGTVTGNVRIDAGGTVLSDCGTLTFTGIMTNNGTMRAINGGALETFSNLVNNGTIDIINGGITNFHGSFINHGTILDASSVKVSGVNASAEDFVLQIPSASGHTYQLQFTSSLTPTNWANLGSSQSGNGSTLTFVDSSGLTNSPARFYRVDCIAP